MPEYLSKEDIYDENGILLLCKGQKMTDAVIAKLKRFGSYKSEEPVDPDAKQKVVSSPVIQTFGARKNIRNDRILEYPNKILSTIIFESKTKPWWIYVNALSNYVDWIYTHSIDVAIISLMIAVELGYNDEELWNMGLGAFLHDIGKLLVPKPIIQKPGRLTDMEMVYMRQHCELGMSSLEPFCLPKKCTDIVLQHHERLDGSGYPKGLRGDEICRNARIVMIADAADAITSGRPYKQPRKIDAAIKILRNEKEKYSQELITLLEKILE
ncbi:MAG: HD domain-containing phosphohydrolase [Clostridiaceae bacterium]|jgi:putative nucleotidyltransferase with HDIG domain|nr:HD domain-containing phosphohydrolase [Clostridiaceae bacterium]